MGKSKSGKSGKSNNLVVCIVCGILTAFGIVTNIISLATGGTGIWTVTDVCTLLVSVLIGYYAFIGYHRPHGNLLKYIILIFSAARLVGIYLLAQSGKPWQAILGAVMIGLGCYIAGRLHKVKQNIILMSIVAVLTLIAMALELKKGIWTIGALTPRIIWIDIFVAYVLRYKEHREAGLMDAGK